MHLYFLFFSIQFLTSNILLFLLSLFVMIQIGGQPDPNRSASIKVKQEGMGSTVKIKVRSAKPDHLYTVWILLKGKVVGTQSLIGGNPITGKGATACVPGSALDYLLSFTPPYDGKSGPIGNAMVTNEDGNADFTIELDFPLVGGAYPFQMANQTLIDNWVTEGGGNATPMRKPVPIINPNDENIEGHFLLRVVSHFTDNLSHGLDPDVHEGWFNYP